MPSIKQLQYFCALAEDNNMSRLASKLYISQAALSNSISRLESELDAELFDRTPGGLVLNECGELYRLHAQSLLNRFEAASFALKAKKSQTKLHLSVAVNSASMYNNIFSQFLSFLPDCSLHLYSVDQPFASVSKVIADVDLVIAGQEELSADRFYTKPFCTWQIYVCVPPHHKFSDRAGITLDECREEAFIFQPPYTGFSRFSEKLFATAGYQPRVVAWCDYATRKNLLTQNIGIALASDLVKWSNSFPDCVFIPLEPRVTREMSFFWSKNRPLSQQAQIFIQYAIDYVQQYMKD